MSKKTPKVDPRIRMKEIRANVALSVKNNVRIDQMDFGKKDTARVMIALQDQLDESMQAHKRATKHVMDQKAALAAINILASYTMESMLGTVNHTKQALIEVVQQRDGLTNECQRLSDGWQEANKSNLELRQELVKRGAQLDSTMHTLKTLFEQEEPVYSYEGEEVAVNTHG